MSKYFQISDSINIPYTNVGRGTPVVLVHGFCGSTESWVHNGTAKMLSKHFQLTSMNQLLGFYRIN